MEQEPLQVAKTLRGDGPVPLEVIQRAAELLELQADRIIRLNEILAQEFKAYVGGVKSQ